MADKLHDIRRNYLNVPAEEAYRVLRSNIQFCGYDKKIKTLVITSCNPGEGKTTTSFNLAVSMAKSGIKTLLVDADLRKPMLAKGFEISNSVGLSNYISGQASLEDIINYTSMENFSFVSCGPTPPNPAELLNSKRFKEFMKTTSENYDMVIYDTPPLRNVIDCALVSSQADGTIIVIKANEVDHREVQKVKEQLEKANANILGVVINKVGKRDFKYYYNYGEYYGKRDKKGSRLSSKFKIFRKRENMEA